MTCQSLNKMLDIKSIFHNIIQQQQDRIIILVENIIHHSEIIFIIKDIEVIDNVFIGNIFTRKTYHLVKDRQCITKCAISFLSNDIKCFFLCHYTFLDRNILQMFTYIIDSNSLKIKDLTSRQNRWDDFMFFCSGKNKFSIRRRFFQSLKECIESCLRKHMNLIYDIHLVFTNLRRNSNLINEVTNIINRIVRSGI